MSKIIASAAIRGAQVSHNFAKRFEGCPLAERRQVETRRRLKVKRCGLKVVQTFNFQRGTINQS